MGTITTAMCNSFKQELLGGVHDLDTHTLKIALIKPSPTSNFNKATTNYSDLTANSDEATGTNYTAEDKHWIRLSYLYLRVRIRLLLILQMKSFPT